MQDRAEGVGIVNVGKSDGEKNEISINILSKFEQFVVGNFENVIANKIYSFFGTHEFTTFVYIRLSNLLLAIWNLTMKINDNHHFYVHINNER